MLRSFVVVISISLTCAQNLLFEPVTDTAPKPCCSSDKLFEVTMNYLGATMKAGNADAIVETHRMAMDVVGQRVSLKIYEAETPEISYYYIYLYKQKEYYLVVPNVECLKYNLNTTFETPCMPAFSKYVGSNQLDPENHLLEVNHWHDESKGYPSQYTTSEKHCLPVSESYYYSLHGPQAQSKILKITYSDYKSGITDPSVFTPPSSGCIPGGTPPSRHNFIGEKFMYKGIN